MNFNQEKVNDFGNLELFAKQTVEGFITGLHKSPYHGFSVEFAEHRPYNKGSSTKHIDWKLFARTEKLFTKIYEEETNLRCQIIIDSSSSMNFPRDSNNFNKLSFSVHSAAILMNLFKKQRDAVGLTLFDENIKLHTQTKTSSRHHLYLLSELQKLLNKEEKEVFDTKIHLVLHHVSELIHKRSLVVIFSDMFQQMNKSKDNLYSALQHLRYNKHEVVLFHVTDFEKEIKFDFENKPTKFIDLESGKTLSLIPSNIKEGYVNKLNKYEEELKTICSTYNIDFIKADINKGFTQILLNYLLKRQKLF